MAPFIVAEKIQIILKFVRFTLVTGFVGSVALASLALHAAHPDYLAIVCWFALSMLNFLFRYLKIARARPNNSVSLGPRATWHTFISGCVWGAAALLFVPSLSPESQAAFTVILLGLNITSIPLMSDAMGISVLFLPAWLSMALAFYISTGTLTLPFAVIFMLCCVYLVAHMFSTTLNDFIALWSERRTLHDTNAMQMSFFLAASHDFRQPLQSMSFYVMAIKRRLASGNGEVGDVVIKLQDAFEKLEHLVDETIGFAKISMGLVPPATEMVSTFEMVESLIATFRHSAEAKGLSFRVYCGKGCLLKTNIQILRRILDNLVSNALRNTVSGGVLVAFRSNGEGCSIEVWDTGIGIPAHEKERIFDAFYQIRGQRKDETGHGLGLMIVKRLCERINADLTFSSRVNKGTVFRLKLATSNGEVKIATQSKVFPLPSVRLDGHTIAIVDDDQNVRDSMGMMLSDAGAKVIASANLEMLLAQLEKTDVLHLLLTDLHLTNVLGDQVVEAVRTHFPKAKVIILTGDASQETLARLNEKGLAILLKPTPSEVLLAKVSSALSIAPVTQ